MRCLLIVLVSGGILTGQPLPSEARLEETIRRLERLASDNPRDVEFWHQLGGAYCEAEMWSKAVQAETEAITRFPKYAVAYHGRGKAYAGLEQWPEAHKDFTQSITLLEARGGRQLYLTVEQPPDFYIDSYRSRGVALARMGKLDLAIADLEAALSLRKDDPKLLYEKGYLEYKAARKVDAVADLSRSGLIYADAMNRQQAGECARLLGELGASADADRIHKLLMPKKQKSDLP